MAPNLKECLRDEKREDNKGQPDQNFGAPVAILEGSTAISGWSDAEEEEGKAEVEETKGEIDALDSDVSVALFALAGYCHVVQRQMFEFSHGPGCEHQPWYDGVEEQDNGIGDSGSHASIPSTSTPGQHGLDNFSPGLKYTASRAYGWASRSSATTGAESEELLMVH